MCTDKNKFPTLTKLTNLGKMPSQSLADLAYDTCDTYSTLQTNLDRG